MHDVREATDSQPVSAALEISGIHFFRLNILDATISHAEEAVLECGGSKEGLERLPE
jgi:hypothetical protein